MYFESSRANKIIYVNSYFNIFETYFKSDFPVYNYKVLGSRSDFRSSNQTYILSCIFFSDKESDLSFYQNKGLQINQITAKNKNAFCKVEEVKNLAFKAQLNLTLNKVGFYITLFNDYYLGHYEYTFYFSNGWVLTHDVYNFTCCHVSMNSQGAAYNFFFFGPKSDFAPVDITAQVDGKVVHLIPQDHIASSTEYPLHHFKYGVSEEDAAKLNNKLHFLYIKYNESEANESTKFICTSAEI